MRYLISAAVLALTLTACGGGDSEPEADQSASSPSSTSSSAAPSQPETTEPSSEATSEAAAASPVETVEAWVAAYGKPDGAAACALQTEKYTNEDLQASIADGTIQEGATCEEGVVAGNALATAFGIDFSKATVKSVSESPTQAVVTLMLEGSDPSTVTLVNDGGSWLIDKEVS